ncbi:hypothetical protein L596_027356 [Steinernema carpocapsae]|uniref:K Homology domain-containing protein n=1 Tax=Steinernema carpocapsae TaxID=34508 RepID=A0A4U5M435_STECR|nr:hypothetical protein L596_027356 [Steinernema carpocapsae]
MQSSSAPAAGRNARSHARTPTNRNTPIIKVPIPTEPADFKYIGRLLGPRGSSIRELEQVTKCRIMIKGKGSMRNPADEEYHKDRPGYEHLHEPLHVRITPADNRSGQANMEMAKSIIENLLVANNDVYKQRQLVQLSLINGTYRPDYSIMNAPVTKEE